MLSWHDRQNGLCHSLKKLRGSICKEMSTSRFTRRYRRFWGNPTIGNFRGNYCPSPIKSRRSKSSSIHYFLPIPNCPTQPGGLGFGIFDSGVYNNRNRPSHARKHLTIFKSGGRCTRHPAGSSITSRGSRDIFAESFSNL
jgi:hypothetical protein